MVCVFQLGWSECLAMQREVTYIYMRIEHVLACTRTHAGK